MLSKQKVCTFANKIMKYTAARDKNKLNEVKMVRNLFGSILSRIIDMEEVSSYHLTPVLLHIYHFDREMRKIPKNILM